ncbi:3-oxoacyl-ACP synthase III family protein [Legionella pneumophila]|uniref:3-oxoacyl-ACP synthase III family protein n=1 Tax=Legionella pneumophila TaxID=446 RepID=UPI00026D9AA3|nr:ketoacyl-ACP synthase III [Legionella pneumophila]CCD09571.1 3-oxoacyl-(acyl carrier protein) synthase III FabH [Legionella pneumophila subsp. pneumophila]CZI77540.1 3-oxoacyl-[acyl-carrier-protein] synthase 3 [Legionella pneumophila]CZQ86525.1 3-oxoacyl-[acyl-carrier-protein] synthase 3 [Legionella pneumophila]STX66734.1 3-oxoacyl-(acyl-carrier-protein) [Legionella pneumophila]HAT8702378.1 ketoacyl-ACP synthase III [Legionella pneumophila]
MNFFRCEKPIYIKGPCVALPERVMSNQDVLNWMNSTQNPAVIGFSTGIKNRHWVNEDQACSDLAVRAAEQLFMEKPEEKHKVNQVILATISGDYPSPPSSPLVQYRLGLQNAGAFDIGAACAGFVVGLHTSAALAQTNGGSVLLIASEIRSKFLNKNNFATSVLFGDGAAACCVSQDKEKADFRFIASALFADGEVYDAVSTPAGGSRLPAAVCNDNEQFYITIKESTALFVKAVHGMADSAKDFLKELNLTISDIQWLVPHQGNKNLVLSVAKQLGFPEEKTIKTVEETGNTSGSSVGIALDRLRSDGKIKSGEKVLLVAAGGGGIAACSLLEVI